MCSKGGSDRWAGSLQARPRDTGTCRGPGTGACRFLNREGLGPQRPEERPLDPDRVQEAQVAEAFAGSPVVPGGFIRHRRRRGDCGAGRTWNRAEEGGGASEPPPWRPRSCHSVEGAAEPALTVQEEQPCEP